MSATSDLPRAVEQPILQHANENSIDELPALHQAAKLGQEDVVLHLLEQGTALDPVDNKGRTPLHYAVFAGHESATMTLLDRGANVLAADEDGATALHLAVREDQVNCASILLNHHNISGVMEAKDIYGLTALHTAVRFAEFRQCESLDMTRLLLQQGARVDTQNHLGRYPLQEAARYESADVYDLLRKHLDVASFERAPRDGLWARIRAYMSHIFYHPDSITVQMQTAMYGTVHSVLTSGKDGRGGRMQAGETLYWNVRDCIADHIRESSAAADGLSGEALYTFSTREQAKVGKAGRQLKHLFSYLNRHWVLRAQDEGKRDVHEFGRLHSLLWGEYFVNPEPHRARVLAGLWGRQTRGAIGV